MKLVTIEYRESIHCILIQDTEATFLKKYLGTQILILDGLNIESKDKRDSIYLGPDVMKEAIITICEAPAEKLKE